MAVPTTNEITVPSAKVLLRKIRSGISAASPIFASTAMKAATPSAPMM